MSYEVEFEPDAIADLEKLSSKVGDRIFRKVVIIRVGHRSEIYDL